MRERVSWVRVAAGVIGLGAFSLLIAHGFGMPAYAEICETAKESGKEQCSAYYMPLVILWHISKRLDHDTINVISTAVIAAFTVALWAATKNLALLADRQEKATKDIQRGWLLVREWEMTGWPNTPIPSSTRAYPLLSYRFTNGGLSPIFVTETSVTFRYMDVPLPKAPVYADFTELANTPISGEKDFIPRTVVVNSLEESDRKKAEDNGFVLYGIVKYKDIFDREHETRFCVLWHMPPMMNEAAFFRHGGLEYNKHT